METKSKPKEDIRLLYIDLFCGAGGTSTGVENAVVDGRKIAKVIACVNHDAHAIASHAANLRNEDVVHFTEDIRTLAMEPLAAHVDKMRAKYPSALVVLWASMECTNLSRAKGGISRDADSRTLCEHLYRYIEALRPDIIQCENVSEILSNGPLCRRLDKEGNVVMVKKSSGSGKNKKTWLEPAMVPDPEHAGEYYHKWVRQICSYGYQYEYRILNSADYGAYTSRSRYFGMFVREGLPMVFPMPTHARNPERNLFGEKLQPWKAVREVLDLQDEGESIFDRKKPLVDATLRRIKAGLYKFVAGGETAFLTKAFSGNPEEKCSSLGLPAGSVTTIDHHQFISTYYRHGENRSIGGPAPTVTTKDRISLVSIVEDGKRVLFLDNQYGTGVATPLSKPCGALTTNPKQNLVEAVKDPFIMDTQYHNTGSSLDGPFPVVTANRKWHYIVNPQFNDAGSSIEKPCPTVIARQDKKPLQLAQCKTRGPLPSFIKEEEDGTLVYEVYDTDSEVLKDIKTFMCVYGIIDVTMRMLRIKELKLIQGFPADYILVGTQEEQKKYLGNAVVTIVSQRWCEAIVDTLVKKQKEKAA